MVKAIAFRHPTWLEPKQKKMPCASCPLDAAAAAQDALSVQAAAAAIETPVACTCFTKAALKRERLLANPTRNPGLKPRRVSNFRRPDPCTETLDPLSQALAEQLGLNGAVDDGCGKRVCKVPSLFTANNGREAAALCFELGFTDQLADAQTQGRGAGGICTQGLGGGGAEKRYAQLCTASRNLLQRPYAWCRQPSVFTCSDGRCQASLCLELGITDALPDQQQRNYNAGCASTAGLGGGRGPGDKTYGDLCVRVTRFGNTSAGL